ncbi:Rieske (2Fe-2S) protein [Microlunatus elymi]|uniref:Cytochrome bc1 complex Rieske iron-sulfur subunit n=2 Tax=Microlunatus elymi TaxID=2596828 RepID=A0A516Q642_9ACTN|nr:Rieske (2Fe-2S) protein [Microlunatus elymi]
MVEAFLKSSKPGSRRDLFRSLGLIALGGGGAAVLGACSGGAGGAASGASSAAPMTIAKSDVPSGSGVIKGAYVVTQPSSGDFKAFSSTCTHQGCPVSQIQGTTITCNCHGSQFSIKDGSVLRGPADKPLNPAKVTADGNQLDVSA